MSLGHAPVTFLGVCTYCDYCYQIEDEFQLLFHCTKYCTFRDEFYVKIENQIPIITQLPPMQATKKLMNPDNYYLNTQLMKFILRCLSLRNNLLSNESDGTHT